MIVSNRRVDLIEEGVDVAIRVRERLDTDADLQVKIIGRTSEMLVASPASARRPRANPRRRRTFRASRRSARRTRPGLDRWTLVNEAGEEAVVLHEPRLSASSFPILMQAAIDGLGVAFLAEYACREPLADGRLERVLPAWAGREGILHLVFTSRRGLLPGVRAVIDFTAEVLHPRTGVWRTAALRF